MLLWNPDEVFPRWAMTLNCRSVVSGMAGDRQGNDVKFFFVARCDPVTLDKEETRCFAANHYVCHGAGY